MAKKVLIAEASLAVRGIAESLLRQNGYDVTAADSAEAAREILAAAKVDLLLVGSDLVDNQGKPFRDSLRSDPALSAIPVLILHDAAAGQIDYPPASVVNKPFTPREFLESVSGILAGPQDPVGGESFPFDGADFEEELIDSALGLDKIEVNGSEVLEADSEAVRNTQKKGGTEELIGFKTKLPADNDSGPVRKVEAVNLPPEKESSGKIPLQPAEKANLLTKKSEKSEFLGSPGQPTPVQPPDKLSESSKIEIVTDQYGIIVPEPMASTGTSQEGDDSHDYEWFLRELKKETTETDESSPKTARQTETARARQEAVPPAKAGVRAESAAELDKLAGDESGSGHSPAIDKFISEFKKEVEKITSDTSAGIEVTQIPAPDKGPASRESDLQWENGLDLMTPAEIRGMSKQLIDTVADRIAQGIVAGLDQERVFRMFKEAIDQILSRKESVRKK